MFSDGVDDDANGYKDDIAGWDFFKNDNDPYDDTRYGHGTGEARDSAAEANNGDGEPGVCPKCRFVPLRVGNSFIADANDFGKAVIYGADIGAKVIQEALGTINRTAFSTAAIDYAYAKGAIVMASMADENSRHHNAPATAQPRPHGPLHSLQRREHRERHDVHRVRHLLELRRPPLAQHQRDELLQRGDGPELGHRGPHVLDGRERGHQAHRRGGHPALQVQRRRHRRPGVAR